MTIFYIIDGWQIAYEISQDWRFYLGHQAYNIRIGKDLNVYWGWYDAIHSNYYKIIFSSAICTEKN